jgi:signal peptidase I
MSRALKYTIGIVGTVLFAVVWYFFAPTQIGGQASYVTIRGVSMEPLIHRGDLVILKKQSSYKVGDIVGYRSSVLHELVLHRIKAVEGDHFVMQGDANPAPDSDQPTPAQVVGERWIQLDGMGTWLQRARDPKGAALLSGLAVLLTGGAVGATHSKRRRRPKTTTPPLPRRSRPPASTSPPTTAALVVIGVVGVFSLLLALAAFTHSSTHEVTVANLWQEQAVFGYSAKTRPGMAYPSGSVKTGQPVFTKLVKELKVSFDYQASSTREPLVLRGKASLAAIVVAGNGWTRRIPIAPQKSLKGGRVHLAGTLDLAQIQALKDQLGSLIGVPLDSIQVVLQPSLQGSGTIGGRPVQASFSPTYTLRLDNGQLQVETQGPSGPLTNNTPLQRQSQSGSQSEPRSLSLKLFTPSVKQARLLSALLLLLCAVGLVLIWIRLRLRPESDEPEEIERKYGQLLVPVSRVQAGWNDPVEVESIEALVHLAERYDRAILHVLGEGVHHYMVEEDGSLYRYVAFDGVLVGQQAAAGPAQPAGEPGQAAGNGAAGQQGRAQAQPSQGGWPQGPAPR